MDEHSVIVTFKGKPIQEMDRGELIEALLFFAAEYERQNTPVAIKTRALGLVEMMKRGER